MTSGDWADTKPKQTTDRTQSMIELVNLYEDLTGQLNHLKTLCWNVCYGENFIGALDNLKKEVDKWN